MSTHTENPKIHRRGWIDYARGFVIIYVVYRHAMTGLLAAGIPIKNAIYLVQESSMPIFFIVSGIFIQASADKRGLGTFVKFKLESLIYPYFIWAGIHLSIQILLSEYTNYEKDIYFFTYLITQPRAIDQFWYLYTLFSVMVIFVGLNLAWLHFKVIPNMLVALILYLSSYFISTDWFSLNDILFYYLFLFVGFLMSDHMLPVNNQFFKGKWLIPVLPVFVALQFFWWTRYAEIHKLEQLDFLGFWMFIPITVISAFLIFMISYKLDEWNMMKFLKYIGSHSLYIYIMHLIFTAAIRVFLLKFWPELPPFIMLILIMAGGILLSIGTYKVLMKLNMKFLFEPTLKGLPVYGKKSQ
jgi:fucose 4-O-acetylase-like acetyltransferase